jgi:hypothetical protein
MNRAVAVILGLVPAGLMTIMALIGIGFLDGWRLLLPPAAIVGFIGMGWAIVGYAEGQRRVVLAMLLIGETAMAWGLLTQIVDLASPNKAIGWKLLSMWMTLGPFVVGATYLWRAVAPRPTAAA